MIRIPYEDIVEKIKQKVGLSEEDIKAKVDAKLKQLSGLISKEGAAYIIANELNVKLVECSGKIKDIYAGMRNAEVYGKVQQIFEIREFQRQDGTKGHVGNFMIGDETGTMRVVGWGSKADILNKIQTGDVIRITGALARENQGRKEVHLNDQSNVIINPNGVSIGEIKQTISAKRKNIKDLAETDQNVELLGTIVQAFDPRFFEVCPECGKRTKEQDGKFVCPDHKEITPAYSYVFNVFLDDGTDNIRCIFFRNQAEKILNKSNEEMIALKASPEKFEEIKLSLLGNIVKLVGRIQKNTFFDRLEFITQLVFPDPDPEEELARLKNE